MGFGDVGYTWPPNDKKRIDSFSESFPQRPNLQSLPEELLIMVIDQLEGDTASLSRLSLVNKTFARLTKPTLYRSIRVGAQVSSSGLIHLVRTLLQHSDYVALIKDLCLTAYFADIRGPRAEGLLPRHRFGRTATDAFDRFDNRNYAFLNDCCRKIDSWVPERRGADVLVAMRWKAAVLQHQSPAFASLLLAMCSSLRSLSFSISLDDGDEWRSRLALPCIFGFAAEDESAEAGFCLSDSCLPLFLGSGLQMPEVQHLKIHICNNIDIVRLGFGKLTTLDISTSVGYRFANSNLDRYGSTRIDPVQVKSMPGVKNLVFRIDYEELVLFAGDQISRFVRHVDIPQLTSLMVVLQRSPRKLANFQKVQVSFDWLMSQLKDHNARTLFDNLEEFKVLIIDNTAAFDKEFLHRFQPCTSLAWLPRLKKLTVPWQALSHCAQLRGYLINWAEVLPMAGLPPSLEVLRILYPHAQTPLQLAGLFPSGMGQLNQLQEVEILFHKRWEVLDRPLRPYWERVLVDLPVKVTLGWVPSVEDEIKALTASFSK
ncbi:hypothetical protein G6514_005449 [Epicoccum nigrum]|nr:hypothetical protein G6514_005449 [Epicoccum nigrum]